ncbi:hypothetical protein OF83DRAFT_1178700, partial [Amylostereum chailletii]
MSSESPPPTPRLRPVPNVRIAPRPFDGHGSSLNLAPNFILKSSDGVYFYVRASTLKLTSPAFGDVVTASPGCEYFHGLPVVPIPVFSLALDLALRFIYPDPNPVIRTKEDILSALMVDRLYGIPALKEAAQAALQVFVYRDFVLVFHI